MKMTKREKQEHLFLLAETQQYYVLFVFLVSLDKNSNTIENIFCSRSSSSEHYTLVG